MIQRIIFLFSLLFSLSLLPSCTLFGSGDSSDEQAGGESYYDEEGEETKEEEEEVTASGEDSYESDQNLSVDTPPPSIEGEDIYYIDEEDEDMVAEGEIVEEEESYEVSEEEASADNETASTPAEGGEGGEGDEGGGSFFASSSPAVSGEDSSGDSGGNLGGGSGGGSVSPPPRLSYKKIKNETYKAGAFLVNAVYIARPEENLTSISNKIFGSDETGQLQTLNPHLKLRQVKVGDKIYYQSPRRPSDSSQILFYFEEQGAQAHYHQIQAGQNIREVAKELLGHESSWKEIWATNPNLQSKWTVGQAIEIKYWPISQQETESPPLSAESQESVDSIGDPTAEDDLKAEGGGDPAVEDNLTAEEQLVEDNPPPPPSQAQVLEEMQKDVPAQKVSGFSKMFQSTDVVMGLALAFVAFVAFFVVMRKRKRKQNFDYTATNFEIEE